MTSLAFHLPSGIDEDDEDDYPQVDYASLMRHFPGSRLLPNLTKFYSSNHDLSDHYPLFIHSTLTSLHIDDWGPLYTQPIVDTIHRCSESLKHLRLEVVWNWDDETEGVSPEVSASVSRAISSLHALSSLSAGRLLPETLVHLAGLPELEDLDFYVYDVGYADVVLHSPTPYRFSTLRSLKLSCGTTEIASMITLMTYLSAPTLELLHISFHIWDLVPLDAPETQHQPRQPTEHQMIQLFSLLVKFTTLRSLEIYSDSYRLAHPNRGIPFDALHQLFGLQALEDLNLSDVPVRVQPHQIEHLATAWPNIRSLRLGEDMRGAIPVVQVEDLVPFAVHCPKLTELGIVLRIPARSACLETNLPFERSTSVLQNLRVGGSEVVFSSDVAAFVALTFPRASLNCSKRTITQCYEVLTQMNSTIQTIKTVMAMMTGGVLGEQGSSRG